MISDERFERPEREPFHNEKLTDAQRADARALLRGAYIWADERGEPPAFAIELVAGHIATAEARGRAEGIRVAQKVMHAEKLMARDCGEAATVLALQSIHRDLEQCIASLQPEKEGA